MSLELTEQQKALYRLARDSGKGDEYGASTVNELAVIILKLQGAKMKAEHDLLATEENEIGTHKDCEQCYYSDEQWMEAAQAELSREGKG